MGGMLEAYRDGVICNFFLVEQTDTLAFSSGSNLNVPQDTWLP